jgi:hypothetical protein
MGRTAPSVGKTGYLLRHGNPREERPGRVVGRGAPFEERSGGFDRQRSRGIPHTRPRLGDGSIGLERRSHRPLDALGAPPLVEERTLISRKSQIPFIVREIRSRSTSAWIAYRPA